jgi:hypothetical protein
MFAVAMGSVEGSGGAGSIRDEDVREGSDGRSSGEGTTDRPL